MNNTPSLDSWLPVLQATIVSYRRMVDATIEQLTDSQLFQRPSPEANSVAIILRHLGGNLRSRWTDFRESDGEKPDRDRDQEFAEWVGDRTSLMQHFEHGWKALEAAINTMTEENVQEIIHIRGEPHTVLQALVRSITHVTYHVGQITMVGRMVHEGEWKWFTVAPGASADFNKQTWGTSASRSILADPSDSSEQS